MGFQLAFSKQELRKVIKEYPVKEVGSGYRSMLSWKVRGNTYCAVWWKSSITANILWFLHYTQKVYNDISNELMYLCWVIGVWLKKKSWELDYLLQVKKGLDGIYKKTHKDLCEEENLVQVVWFSMQDEFIKQVKHYEDLINQCYTDSGITLEFKVEDVLSFFSEIAQNHWGILCTCYMSCCEHPRTNKWWQKPH